MKDIFNISHCPYPLKHFKQQLEQTPSNSSKPHIKTHFSHTTTTVSQSQQNTLTFIFISCQLAYENQFRYFIKNNRILVKALLGLGIRFRWPVILGRCMYCCWGLPRIREGD